MFTSSLEFSFMKLSFYEGEIVSVKLRARGSLIMKTKKKPKTREIKSKKCQPLA
jgi:predicted DNA-binding antitoxin AbrB/MazE fold protein